MDREKHLRDSTEMGMTVELFYITFSHRESRFRQPRSLPSRMQDTNQTSLYV